MLRIYNRIATTVGVSRTTSGSNKEHHCNVIPVMEIKIIQKYSSVQKRTKQHPHWCFQQVKWIVFQWFQVVFQRKGLKSQSPSLSQTHKHTLNLSGTEACLTFLGSLTCLDVFVYFP